MPPATTDKGIRIPITTLNRWRELTENPDALAVEVAEYLAGKLPAAPAPKQPVVAIGDFLALAKEYLGVLLVLPARLSGPWYGKMTVMLRYGGIEGPLEAAELLNHLASWVTKPILADTIAAKSGAWLAMARAQRGAVPSRGPTYGGANEMEIE